MQGLQSRLMSRSQVTDKDNIDLHDKRGTCVITGRQALVGG